MSAQSQSQKILLSEQPPDQPLVIQGPFEVYLREQVVTYFILYGKTRPDYVDDTDLDGKYIIIMYSCIIPSESTIIG